MTEPKRKFQLSLKDVNGVPHLGISEIDGYAAILDWTYGNANGEALGLWLTDFKKNPTYRTGDELYGTEGNLILTR